MLRTWICIGAGGAVGCTGPAVAPPSAREAAVDAAGPVLDAGDDESVTGSSRWDDGSRKSVIVCNVRWEDAQAELDRREAELRDATDESQRERIRAGIAEIVRWWPSEWPPPRSGPPTQGRGRD